MIAFTAPGRADAATTADPANTPADHGRRPTTDDAIRQEQQA
ncbi:hypothetical protein [Streptomyces coeruleorubidus]